MYRESEIDNFATYNILWNTQRQSYNIRILIYNFSSETYNFDFLKKNFVLLKKMPLGSTSTFLFRPFYQKKYLNLILCRY